jgi:predicted AAA+ superfamily ATPase
MVIRKIYHHCLQELSNDLILLIVWARQIGKTTILKQLQHTLQDGHTTYFLNLEDPDIKSLLNIHPNKLFEITGSTPQTQQYIFIDEIQYLDNPTNFLKYIYDEYKGKVKLIVSGSSSFDIDQKFKDSLVGRKSLVTMYTCDFEEFLDFKWEQKLKKIIFEDKKIPVLYKFTIDQLFVEYCLYGGYPEIILLHDIESKKRRLQEFAFDYIRKDIYDSNIADRDKFLSLLKILAWQTWELVNMSELANTLNLTMPTIEKYLYIMQKSFHITLMRPFYTNISKELTKMPKIYFYDTGLRNSLVNNFEPIVNRNDRWALTENIVMRELMVQHGIDAIKFRRTQSKNEVDFIINEQEAIEVKFQSSLIKPNKYKSFQSHYPSLPLQFITFGDIMNKIIL